MTHRMPLGMRILHIPNSVWILLAQTKDTEFGPVQGGTRNDDHLGPCRLLPWCPSSTLFSPFQNRKEGHRESKGEQKWSIGRLYRSQYYYYQTWSHRLGTDCCGTYAEDILANHLLLSMENVITTHDIQCAPTTRDSGLPKSALVVGSICDANKKFKWSAAFHLEFVVIPTLKKEMATTEPLLLGNSFTYLLQGTARLFIFQYFDLCISPHLLDFAAILLRSKCLGGIQLSQ